MHPRWIAALCVAPRANSAAIPLSSRLASPAPRRSRCSGGFIHELQAVTVPFAVLASGSGTNMQALLDHEDRGAAYRIELLIVDRPCAAEERALAKGRAVYRVDFGGGNAAGEKSRAPGPGGEDGTKPGACRSVGDEVVSLLERHGVRGVLLAGFLKLLPAEVCRAYPGGILNIHPALLPAFGGKGMYGQRVHEAVLRSGATVSGPTIHFVNERYDEGRILAQWPVPVEPDDTAQSLAERVLEVEHILFPAAADALAWALGAGGVGRKARSVPAFRWPGTGVQTGHDLKESIESAFGGAGA